MTNVIPLHQQIKAIHPTTGKPITIVGIDTSSFTPRLIVLHQTFEGIFAEIIDDADLPTPTAAA